MTPAPLTITANNQTKVYGAALPTLTASYSGFRQRRHRASLDHAADTDHDGHGRQPRRAAYAITATGAVDPNYTISYVTGTLTVTPAPLTITANNQTKVYGAALPRLTASLRGFVNGDTAPALTTRPHVDHHGHRRQPRAGSPTGSRPAGAVDPNYTISYVAGTLTRDPGPADDHGQQPEQGLRRGPADA